MSKKGFTLIELLIVISIIAVLSTIGLTSFVGIQSRARDSSRKNDLNTLATALELYYQNQKNGKYIDGVTTCQTDSNPSNNTFYNAIKSYLSNPNSLPKDPASNQAYCYISVNNGKSYRLFAKLENCPTQDTIPGINCQTAIYNFVKTPD